MYTFKRKGKTVGKRLSKQQMPLYLAQIESFRAYERLAREFLEVNERLADLKAASGADSKKNSSKRSGWSKKPKPGASWKK